MRSTDADEVGNVEGQILLLFGLVAVLGPWASAENKTVVIVKRSAPANARARDAVVLPVRTRAVSRPRASAFAANAHSPVAAIGGPRSFGGDSGDSRAGMDSDATGMNSVGTSMNSAMASSMDFNPALLGGIRGAPGLKIRINMPTFRYVTMLVRQILDREIIRARIPPISQEIQELRGRISVCNIYVSSYRPPCDVAVVPIAPNSVLLSIHDLDIGDSNAAVFQLSLDVLLSLQIGPDGMPFVTVSSCTACVGYVDLCIECGGLVGEIANLPLFRDACEYADFQRMAAERVQKMVTDQICKSVPQLVNERVNPMLRRLPRGISYNQIVSMTGGLLGPEVLQ
ncbi:hypothetical protein Tcan_18535 [Toxocara canis]|uniref:Lipid-binding serum glycoprotein N-terminal domain-containing protein n=1 Tax=Toxocara canis TaxID=6265 RepID=A0A0B2VQJ0_TOXCA|nr:hypothetical protein Tcan_18535 [Toxocara canis]